MEALPLRLRVNGTVHHVEVEHRKTLVDTIRENCGLTGTHVGCEHGVCGACTVLVDGAPVRSCLMFAHQASDVEIRTVEDLARGDTLHVLQTAFIENHALQCGFCTPGFLMLVVGAFERDPDIAADELIEILSSNSLPLHRLSEHRQGGSLRRWRTGGGPNDNGVRRTGEIVTLIKLKRHGRYDYSPIVERPVFDWPGGKRLAVAICNNRSVQFWRWAG